MKNGDQFIMRVTADELESIKQTIDSNIKETDDVGKSDDDDILIKYFDMFEKGLITREEFDLKKAELYNKTEDNTLLKQEHVHPLYCSSCGNKLDENANFCPYCGNKIN
ncbi:zinc-ribbon domain-containing protein [uncultured Methanobrevibacter sp.]|nr:zinc-ribbon domain-containing protein [uncultured Methanobrevibacter sp.]